ncbi:MAG: hypothetical protein V4541_00185 [Bacteroidota bacterium]
MKELNDKDFDQLFKERIAEGLPPFEEESWLKMEKKLARKDRFVFYRNASIILLFLSFGLGFYFMNRKEPTKTTVNAIHKAPQNELKNTGTPGEKEITNAAQPNTGLTTLLPASNVKTRSITGVIIGKSFQSLRKEEITELPIMAQNEPDTVALATATPDLSSGQITAPDQLALASITPTDATKAELKNVKKNSRKIPISVALSFGPDFNSTEKVVGGKGSMAMGLSVSVGLFKKLSLQTGIAYGAKNYEASGYDYAFNNPNVANSIAAINAACKVLEIPLRASYQLTDQQHSSIDLNAGLSSYIMLKEDYNFIYTAVSGRKDRLLEKTNANQHYLSVIDLSATYNIKLKNKKFALGIEPYLKIPMSGIGEGNVPLKSSGVSLKIRYDLNKK